MVRITKISLFLLTVLFLSPVTTNADYYSTAPATQLDPSTYTYDGTTFTFSTDPFSELDPGTTYRWCNGFYSGVFPNQGTTVEDGGSSTGNPAQLKTVFQNNFPYYSDLAIAQGDGEYWYSFQVSTAGESTCASPAESLLSKYIQFTVSSSTVSFSPYIPQLTDDTYQTRFIDATVSTTATTSTSTKLSFDIDYIIDTTDFNSTYNRPDTIVVSISDLSATQITQQQKLILPLTDGTQNDIITTTDYVPDGSYSATIFFWNFNSQYPVLSRSNLTLNFTIVNQAITAQAIVDSSDGLFPGPTWEEYNECKLTDPVACALLFVKYLVIPSDASLQQAATVLTDSHIPFVENAVSSYEQVITYVDNPTAVSPTLAYSLEIPEAGIDVEMFSVDRMTELMGEAQPIFRNIILVAIVLGFLNMIVVSIRNAIVVDSVTGQVK